MKHLLEQILKFIGVSGIGWILDFITYTLLSLLFANLFLNNILGAIAGTSFVFSFSTKYIFRNKNIIPIYLKYVLYIIYQVVLLLLVSKLLVYIYSEINVCTNIEFIKSSSFIIAKILITPITMCLNFIVLKKMIEKL